MPDEEVGGHTWIKRSAVARGEGAGHTQEGAEDEATAGADLAAFADALKDYTGYRCPEDCPEKHSTIAQVEVTKPELLPGSINHTVNVHVHEHSPFFKFDLDFDRWEAMAQCTWTYYVLCCNGHGRLPQQLPEPPSD